jgi:hypothetical protein
MSSIIPVLPAYFTLDQAAEYMARTDEFALRRIARWPAQMDIEFPMLEVPDLGFTPMERCPKGPMTD